MKCHILWHFIWVFTVCYKQITNAFSKTQYFLTWWWIASALNSCNLFDLILYVPVKQIWLILYVPVSIFQSCGGGSSWVKPEDRVSYSMKCLRWGSNPQPLNLESSTLPLIQIAASLFLPLFSILKMSSAFYVCCIYSSAFQTRSFHRSKQYVPLGVVWSVSILFAK